MARDPGETAFEQLLAELRRIPPNHLTHDRVERLLRSFAGCRMHIPKRDPARQESARRMMATGMERREVAQALQARLEVSESTAYRYIRLALARRRPGG